MTISGAVAGEAAGLVSRSSEAQNVCPLSHCDPFSAVLQENEICSATFWKRVNPCIEQAVGDVSAALGMRTEASQGMYFLEEATSAGHGQAS